VDYQRFAEAKQRSCDEFERRLESARRGAGSLDYAELEELAFQYRQLLHDHALAAARFPGTAVARRLHAVVLQGTHWLQREPGDRLPSVASFLTRNFPRAFRRCLGLVLAVAGLFAVALLLGLCLGAVAPDLGMVLLSPEAIDGLKEGRLWTESVFSVTPGSVASSMIATNNLSVAITGWAGGALAGIGGLYVVVLNGLMLGAVIAVTMHYSMAPALLGFIAAHGPLELTLILVTAGAGLDMGRALVVASDRPRSALLSEAGRNSLVVLLGCLPWIVIAGLVEGFISPAPELSLPAKAGLGLVLLVSFLTFAWNPLMEDADGE
jgi:uncharacterized membrane protein SpoIIM required for sporulation